MPTYNVYLANPYGMAYWWKDLVDAVRALFSEALPVKGYERVAVLNTMGRPCVLPSELLVYVLPSRAHTVVASHFKVEPGASGTTAWDALGTGSEVYLGGQGAVQHVAYLVFHEALHNKLHWSNKKLHGTKDAGLAKDPVIPTMTAGDKKLMRMAMAAHVPQWLGGWDVASDPLRGL